MSGSRFWLLLPALTLTLLLPALGGCDGDSGSKGQDGEGEGEGEQPDAGGDALDSETDTAPPDLGEPDSGIDEWENRVKKKDGISAKLRADLNPKLTVIYTVPVVGRPTRRLCYWQGTAPDAETGRGCLDLRTIGNPSNPYVSPDGDWVVFYEAGGTEMALANLVTREVASLGTILPSDEFTLRNPVVSNQASFVAFQKVYQGATHIIRLDRTRDPAEEDPIWQQQGSAGTPAISSDGSIIVFHSDPGGNNEAWRWSLDVRDTSNISNTPTLHEKDPRISANGDVVCYRSSPLAEGRTGSIVVVSNGVARNITAADGDRPGLAFLNNYDCQLSTTGRHVVFRSMPGQTNRTNWLENGLFYVYDLNADTHRQLPEPTGMVKTCPPDQTCWSPWRLSSDGRWIVFTARPVGSVNPDVWLLDVQSGHTIRLINSPEAEGTGAPGIN